MTAKPIFFVFIFSETYSYYVLPNSEENVLSNCFMGLMSSRRSRNAPMKIKIFMVIWIFRLGYIKVSIQTKKEICWFLLEMEAEGGVSYLMEKDVKNKNFLGPRAFTPTSCFSAFKIFQRRRGILHWKTSRRFGNFATSKLEDIGSEVPGVKNSWD